MAQFSLTPKNNIPLCGQAPIPKGNTCIISISTFGITPSTLFSNYQSRGVLAQQLNMVYGTDFFTKDNVSKYVGYFDIKKI